MLGPGYAPTNKEDEKDSMGFGPWTKKEKKTIREYKKHKEL